VLVVVIAVQRVLVTVVNEVNVVVVSHGFVAAVDCVLVLGEAVLGVGVGHGHDVSF